jgi:hydroxyacyl-ACP dehydratase HTD2-like protein with hotdog domain
MTASPSLADHLTDWRPSPAEQTERITAEPAIALAGLLDCPSPARAAGDALPPLWHWIYLLDRPAQRGLGPDGHPAAGPFLPPIPHRRRMFAGGRADYRVPVHVGDDVTLRSELGSWAVKQGQTGELLFVTVRHTYLKGTVVAVTEEQDLVYRSAPDVPASARPAPPAPVTERDDQQAAPGWPWRLELTPGPVLLFRFSALTYNAHRIHYDVPYATGVEGHAGLVVHGPLLALLCLELPRRHDPGRSVSRLSFRARRPVYVGQACTVSGRPAGQDCELQITTAGGTRAMTASVTFAS